MSMFTPAENEQAAADTQAQAATSGPPAGVDAAQWAEFQAWRSKPDPAMEEAARPVSTGPRRFTGKPERETIAIETREKNAAGKTAQGDDAHEIVIEHDGFGHWRATNVGDDAPYFQSRDDVIGWLTGEHIPEGGVRA